MQIHKQAKHTHKAQNQDQYEEDFQPQQSMVKQEQELESNNNKGLADINNKTDIHGILWQQLLNQQGNIDKQKISESKIQNLTNINKNDHNTIIHNKSSMHLKSIKRDKDKDELKELLENKNQFNDTNAEKKEDEDRQSRIKDTINRITKNIIISKQSIVQDISSITRYYQHNQKQISLEPTGIKQTLKQRAQEHEKQGQKLAKIKIVEHLKKKMEEDQKVKQYQRKRKKEIYEQQKQIRKQLQKNQSKIKKEEIEKRIIYQQKFISRRSGSVQIPISDEEVKAFENAFIQHIKQRLNIGKIGKLKNKHKSLQKLPQNKNGIIRHEHKKNYNKKINKNQRLKQKIIMNLKHKIQNQLEPTYESILTNSKQIQNSGTPEKKRTHQSAPQIRLPNLSPIKPWRRTFYSKQVSKPHKIHILKLSQEKHN